MVGVGVPDAGGRGEVEAAGGGDLVVVVDPGPGFPEAAGGAVGFVDDDEVPGLQVVVSVGGDDGGQGGVGGVDGHRAGGRCEFGQLGGLRRHGEVAGGGVFHGLAGGADGYRRAFVAGRVPGAHRLGEQVQCRDEDQDPPAGGEAGGGAGGDQCFSGAACGDHACPRMGAQRFDRGGDGFFLVGAEFDRGALHALLAGSGSGWSSCVPRVRRGCWWVFCAVGLTLQIGADERAEGGAVAVFQDVELAGDSAAEFGDVADDAHRAVPGA